LNIRDNIKIVPKVEININDESNVVYDIIISQNFKPIHEGARGSSDYLQEKIKTIAH